MEHKIFDYLDTFKGLPQYQLERRIDIFLVPYLEEIFNAHFRVNDFVLVYPEFPIWPKKKDKYELDLQYSRSVYADYLLWSKELSNTVFFVEFKTDSNSVGQEQFDTYLLNCKRGWTELFNDYFEKAIHSSEKGRYWDKYLNGISLISKKAKELTGLKESFDLNLKYKKGQARGLTSELKSMKLKIMFDNPPNLELIYIAPKDSLNEVNKENEDAKKYFQHHISFSDIVNYIEPPILKLLKTLDK